MLSRRSNLGKTYSGAAVPLDYSWDASGGIVSEEGRYAASAVPGIYFVVVTTSEGQADTAVVTVQAPPSSPTLVRVVLAPETAALE